MTRTTPANFLLLLCLLGIASFASPWLVIVDWWLVKPLYPWDFIELAENSGGAEELAALVFKIVVVSTLAAAIGVVGYRPSFRARPILRLMVLLPMVGSLLIAYGTLVFIDLSTVMIVAVHGDDLPLSSRVAWLSGPLMRATAVLASLASAGRAMRPRRVAAP